MKQLKDYNLSKYKEIFYIKKFVNGVTEEEFKEIFKYPLVGGYITLLWNPY